jgi:hypothetical protein
MISGLTSTIRKSLVPYIKSSKPTSSLSLTSLFIISISYILLSVSLISEDNLLVKAGSVSDIISLSVKLSKRVVWSNSLLKDPSYV